LHVAIDRASKFAYAGLHESQTKLTAAEFIKAVPCKTIAFNLLTTSVIKMTSLSVYATRILLIK
jgi:hypothetical protein